MDSELKGNILKSELAAQYDEAVKKLLADKKILAWILKYSAVEYKDCTIDEIVDYIEGTPEISSVAVDPGDTAQSIKGSPTEDIVINEGKVTYDLRFEALAPGTEDEFIQLIVNIEAQNKFNPNYPLLKRAVYYCSRMISAQKGLDFFNSDYNKIKKVYSIWICTNPPKSHRNTITRYKISEENIIGNVKENERVYDLMNIVMLCLGSDEPLQSNALGLLETLLSCELSSRERIEILDKKFDFRMSADTEKEVSDMCNLSEGVYDRGFDNGVILGMNKGRDEGMALGMDKGMALGMDKGIALGRDEGIAIGMDNSTLAAIKNMMNNIHITAKQAMDILEVPAEKRADYEKRLAD